MTPDLYLSKVVPFKEMESLVSGLAFLHQQLDSEMGLLFGSLSEGACVEGSVKLYSQKPQSVLQSI